MLIFAHVGVMENDKEQTTIFHFPIILGYFFLFSSINTDFFQVGRIKTSNTQMTKEKNSLLFNICDIDFFAPQERYTYNNAMQQNKQQVAFHILFQMINRIAIFYINRPTGTPQHHIGIAHRIIIPHTKRWCGDTT